MLGSRGARPVPDRARIVRGVVVSFDGGTYTAVVKLVGSLNAATADLPVIVDVTAGEMVADARVVVALFDPSNAADGVVLGVY